MLLVQEGGWWYTGFIIFSVFNLIEILYNKKYFTKITRDKWVQFSGSVVSDSLQTYGLQHARHPCPSPTSRAGSDSCPLSQWCHPTISSSVFPSPPVFNLSQHQGLFKWVSSSHQVAKVLEFHLNISPSDEHPGLISFRMDCLHLLAVQGTLKSSSTPQSKASILQHSAFSIIQLSHPYMTTGQTIALSRRNIFGWPYNTTDFNLN